MSKTGEGNIENSGDSSESDFGDNPNDLFDKRKTKKKQENSKIDVQLASSIESDIRRNINVLFYLTHKDRNIRQKSKRIFNKIHGASEHLKFIAANSENSGDLTMDEMNQLRMDNEQLRNQNFDLHKIIEKLTAEISKLNDNINQLINKNTIIIDDVGNLSNGESMKANENNGSIDNIIVDKTPSNGNVKSTQRQPNSFASVLKNKSNNNASEPAVTDVSKRNITPVVINVATSVEKNALLGILRINFINEVTIMGIGGTNVRATANNMQNRSKLIEFLKQRGYKFHTYCPVSERRVDIVVKGLPHDDINYGNEIIMEEFKKWGFNPISARLINRPRDENAQLNGFANWHISLPNGTNTDPLFTQKHRIGQCIVRIESLKKRSIVQCYNCLRFHHTATNCYHPTRCLICAGSHKANQCIQSKTVKPKCANCTMIMLLQILANAKLMKKLSAHRKNFKRRFKFRIW